MGKEHLKLIDVYNMFTYDNGTCIIDIAFFLLEQGLDIKIHALGFVIDSVSTDPVIVEHIEEVRVGLKRLEAENRTHMGPTSFSDIKVYLDK
jgi:hypothetical protein